MAGNIIHNPETGEYRTWEREGRKWRPSTEQEIALSQKGGSGAVAAFEGATGMLSLVAPELAEAASSLHPKIDRYGLIGGLAGAGLGVGKGLARLGVKNAGKRPSLAQKATELAEGRATPGGGIKTPSGLLKRPQDFAPAALQGSVRVAESALDAIPGMRVGSDLVAIQRERVMGGYLGKFLGLTDDEIRASRGVITPEWVDQSLTRVDDAYDGARAVIRDTEGMAGKVKEIAEEAAEAGVLTSDDVAALTRQNDDLGQQLLDMRSILRKERRNAATITQGRRMDEIVEKIQKIIKEAAEAADAPEIKQQLDFADKIWSNWRTIDKTNALRQDGRINVNSMVQALARSKGTRTVKGGRAAQDADLDNLVNVLREYQQLSPALQSSGTAERAAAASFLGAGLGINVYGGN